MWTSYIVFSGEAVKRLHFYNVMDKDLMENATNIHFGRGFHKNFVLPLCLYIALDRKLFSLSKRLCLPHYSNIHILGIISVKFLKLLCYILFICLDLFVFWVFLSINNRLFPLLIFVDIFCSFGRNSWLSNKSCFLYKWSLFEFSTLKEGV